MGRRGMWGLVLAACAAGCGPAVGEELSADGAPAVEEELAARAAGGGNPRGGLALVSAGGREMRSRRFRLVSATGQGTPVGEGVCRSPAHVHVPGMGGQVQ